MPKALVVGMTEEQFWESNPRKMKPYMDAFKQQEMMIDTHNWRLGIYIQSAVSSVLSKHGRYIDKPLLQKAEDDRIMDASELREDEIEAAQRRLMMTMGLPKALLDDMGS